MALARDPIVISRTRVLPRVGGSDEEPDYSACVIALDQLPKVGAPATRALEAAGYTSLKDLAGVSRGHLANLHGVGPKAIGIIQAALEEHDLTLS
jgi:hypothetical protein